MNHPASARISRCLYFVDAFVSCCNRTFFYCAQCELQNPVLAHIPRPSRDWIWAPGRFGAGVPPQISPKRLDLQAPSPTNLHVLSAFSRTSLTFSLEKRPSAPIRPRLPLVLSFGASGACFPPGIICGLAPDVKRYLHCSDTSHILVASHPLQLFPYPSHPPSASGRQPTASPRLASHLINSSFSTRWPSFVSDTPTVCNPHAPSYPPTK